MIFSAGLGTRFNPCTDAHPKALELVNGKSLLQHNIEYGFFRNLIGGSFLAFIASLIIVAFAQFNEDISTRNLGSILCCIYFLPILISKLIINKYGKYYAKILYEQFLTI